MSHQQSLRIHTGIWTTKMDFFFMFQNPKWSNARNRACVRALVDANYVVFVVNRSGGMELLFLPLQDELLKFNFIRQFLTPLSESGNREKKQYVNFVLFFQLHETFLWHCEKHGLQKKNQNTEFHNSCASKREKIQGSQYSVPFWDLHLKLLSTCLLEKRKCRKLKTLQNKSIF